MQAGGSRLAWPAPLDPATAIDDFEHDLSMMGALLDQNAESVKGRARYLYELSPELKRSLSSRWLRWHRRQWEPADGMVRTTDMTRAALAAQRLGARPYSLTALQRYATCPYQFLMAAVYRLAPLEAPAPLQKMDPLTRGDLFHQMQAAALRRLQSDGLLPLSAENLPAAQQRLTDRDSRGSRSGVRPPQSGDRSRVAGRDHRHDAGPSRVARAARGRGR